MSSGVSGQATAVLMTANARAIRELPKDHLEYLESSAERKDIHEERAITEPLRNATAIVSSSLSPQVGEEVTEAALSRPELHSPHATAEKAPHREHSMFVRACAGVLPLKPLSAEIEDTSNDKWSAVQ